MFQKTDTLEYWLTEHLRLNGVYWGLTALCLLGHPEALDREETIKYVQSCQTEEGTQLRTTPLTQVVLAHTPDMTHICITLFPRSKSSLSKTLSPPSTEKRSSIVSPFLLPLLIQTLCHCRIPKQAPFGVTLFMPNTTLGTFTVHSNPLPSSTLWTVSMLRRQSNTSINVAILTADSDSHRMRNPIQVKCLHVSLRCRLSDNYTLRRIKDGWIPVAGGFVNASCLWEG